MTRLLLDQGLPREAAEILRSSGRDALHVGEIGMGSASDSKILERAVNDGRVVVTLDADFHALVALAGGQGPSVIRIRREGLRASEVARLVTQIVSTTGRALADGALVTVTDQSIRMHRLPIGTSGESNRSN